MTKDEIIAELKKFSPHEQREIVQAAFARTEEDYELTPEDIAIADDRWREMEEHPERSMSFEELKVVQKRLQRYHDNPDTGTSTAEMSRRHGLNVGDAAPEEDPGLTAGDTTVAEARCSEAKQHSETPPTHKQSKAFSGELTDVQREELRRRYEAYRQNSAEGSDWKTVRGRVERSLFD